MGKIHPFGVESSMLRSFGILRVNVNVSLINHSPMVGEGNKHTILIATHGT